jgi:hypothetical protein
VESNHCTHYAVKTLLTIVFKTAMARIYTLQLRTLMAVSLLTVGLCLLIPPHSIVRFCNFVFCHPTWHKGMTFSHFHCYISLYHLKLVFIHFRTVVNVRQIQSWCKQNSERQTPLALQHQGISQSLSAVRLVLFRFRFLCALPKRLVEYSFKIT